jgi:hypothetical protein
VLLVGHDVYVAEGGGGESGKDLVGA